MRQVLIPEKTIHISHLGNIVREGYTYYKKKD